MAADDFIKTFVLCFIVLDQNMAKSRICPADKQNRCPTLEMPGSGLYGTPCSCAEQSPVIAEILDYLTLSFAARLVTLPIRFVTTHLY